MSRKPLVIIAAGGTGGHMFPAQALAEEMLSRGWRVKLTTDPRGARYAGGFPQTVERVVLRSATFARGGVLGKLLAPFQIGFGVAGALVSMLRDRPACVVGFGGYPSLPAMAASTVLRLPRMIHEQNGVLGRVNELFVNRVSAIACGTWPTKLPPGTTAFHTGNPVRKAVLEKAGSPYITPGDWPMDLLVFGGSQGASVMNHVPLALEQLETALRDRLRVAHQARDEDAELVAEAYEELGVRADVKPFFDDIPARMSKAQLVICRAGASSIADLTVIGRPAILIPFAAAAANHQVANARGMAEAGAAFVIEEHALTAERLAGHIAAIVGEPEGANAAAAAAALSIGKPEAAEMLADLVGKIAFEGK